MRFENTGEEPHHAILFPLLKGKTAADAAEFKPHLAKGQFAEVTVR